MGIFKRRKKKTEESYLDGLHLEQSLMEPRQQAEHEALDNEIQALLDRYHDSGKEPNPLAKGMSWVKTNVKLGMDGSDNTIAELMTDGCNMGIKSLSQYLNQYQAADEDSKNLAKRLIGLEERMASNIRQYL